jgi:hypothetical protein
VVQRFLRLHVHFQRSSSQHQTVTVYHIPIGFEEECKHSKLGDLFFISSIVCVAVNI